VGWRLLKRLHPKPQTTHKKESWTDGVTPDIKKCPDTISESVIVVLQQQEEQQDLRTNAPAQGKYFVLLHGNSSAFLFSAAWEIVL
jgi:hypothetical protein